MVLIPAKLVQDTASTASNASQSRILIPPMARFEPGHGSRAVGGAVRRSKAASERAPKVAPSRASACGGQARVLKRLLPLGPVGCPCAGPRHRTAAGCWKH